MSNVGIGIDFGTSNSAAAVFDGETLTLIPLESQGPIMPSATYIDRALQARTGQQAIDQYISDNIGRTVELIPEVIGEYSQFVEHGAEGETNEVETATRKIYGAPVTDSGLQGRLFRGTKRLLGDERVRRLMVFDHPFRLVALITPLLLRMRQCLEMQVGVGRAQAGFLGCPVNFEGRSVHRNQLALSRLAEAYKHAGISRQTFYAEPIAAAASYLQRFPQAQGQTLLTLDFGGGTLDLCVLRQRGQSFEVVTTHGIALGGDHLDQILYRALLFPLLGQGEVWTRKGFDRELIETRFPFDDMAELLLNWAVSYTLNQNRYTTPVLERIEQGGPARVKFERLREVIQQNLSYLLFAKIKQFKADLSRHEEARLDIPEIDVDLRLRRSEFETLIAEPLAQVAHAVDTTLQQAGLATHDVDRVLGTGGSSLIPAVRQILEERFAGRVVSHDPFTSVAAGLAIADYYQYPTV